MLQPCFMSYGTLSSSTLTTRHQHAHHIPLSFPASSSEGQQMVTLFTELSCLPRGLDPGFQSSPGGSVHGTTGPEGCIKTCIRPAMLKGTVLPLSNLLLSPALILRGVYIKLNVRLSTSPLSWVIALVLPGWFSCEEAFSCFSYTHE